MSPRLQLTKAAPHVLQQYGEQTRSAVSALADRLEAMFEAERAGRIGQAWKRKLDPLFELWCEQSGVVPPRRAIQALEDLEAPTPADVAHVLRTDLGFATDLSRDASEEVRGTASRGTLS